jgi:hypothetical protein
VRAADPAADPPTEILRRGSVTTAPVNRARVCNERRDPCGDANSIAAPLRLEQAANLHRSLKAIAVWFIDRGEPERLAAVGPDR